MASRTSALGRASAGGSTRGRPASRARQLGCQPRPAASAASPATPPQLGVVEPAGVVGDRLAERTVGLVDVLVARAEQDVAAAGVDLHAPPRRRAGSCRSRLAGDEHEHVWPARASSHAGAAPPARRSARRTWCRRRAARGPAAAAVRDGLRRRPTASPDARWPRRCSSTRAPARARRRAPREAPARASRTGGARRCGRPHRAARASPRRGRPRRSDRPRSGRTSGRPAGAGLGGAGGSARGDRSSRLVEVVGQQLAAVVDQCSRRRVVGSLEPRRRRRAVRSRRCRRSRRDVREQLDEPSPSTTLSCDTGRLAHEVRRLVQPWRALSTVESGHSASTTCSRWRRRRSARASSLTSDAADRRFQLPTGTGRSSRSTWKRPRRRMPTRTARRLRSDDGGGRHDRSAGAGSSHRSDLPRRGRRRGVRAGHRIDLMSWRPHRRRLRPPEGPGVRWTSGRSVHHVAGWRRRATTIVTSRLCGHIRETPCGTARARADAPRGGRR